MSLFSFDDRFALMDVTPVDNQFLLELMPGANGDYVKVYLYGLCRCYHPGKDMTLETMAHDLDMTEAQIQSAFRYWERRGLVNRVSDHPVSWQYVNRATRGTVIQDQDYIRFTEALQELFDDRVLTGSETAMAYEWVENLGLPGDVVLMLATYLREKRGRRFSFRAAEKVALRMKEEGIATPEDAEEFFDRDRGLEEGCRRVLKRLGKKGRAPSEDELALYTRWVREDGFTPEAIEAACGETLHGEPSMAYLDGILRGMKQRYGQDALEAGSLKAAQQREQDRTEGARAMLEHMNIRMGVNEAVRVIYDQMRSLYPDEVIHMAAAQCVRQYRNPVPEDALTVLESWKRRGLAGPAEVAGYLEAEERFLQELYQRQWGMRGHRISQRDWALLFSWVEEYGMSSEAIRVCAERAARCAHPMSQTDKLVAQCRVEGITSPDQVRRLLERPAPETRPAKRKTDDYQNQRDYGETTELSDTMKEILKELEADEKRDSDGAAE